MPVCRRTPRPRPGVAAGRLPGVAAGRLPRRPAAKTATDWLYQQLYQQLYQKAATALQNRSTKQLQQPFNNLACLLLECPPFLRFLRCSSSGSSAFGKHLQQLYQQLYQTAATALQNRSTKQPQQPFQNLADILAAMLLDRYDVLTGSLSWVSVHSAGFLPPPVPIIIRSSSSSPLPSSPLPIAVPRI